MEKYGFEEMDGHPAPFRMFGNRMKAVSVGDNFVSSRSWGAKRLDYHWFLPSGTASNRSRHLLNLKTPSFV
ncbi:hypothetical protein [Deinococcus sp. PESE-13]